MSSLCFVVFALVFFGVSCVQNQQTCDPFRVPPGSVEGPSPAQPCRFDYVVSLKHPLFGSHICSGALIKPNWVLTLATCAQDLPGELPTVDIGSNYREAGFSESINTAEVVVHERFTGREALDPYDIALYRLRSDADTTPVDLSSSPLSTGPPLEGIREKMKLGVGDRVDIVGWGRLRSQGPLSDSLQAEEGVSVEPCAGDWPDADDRFACVAGPDGGACPGDAGSPVLELGSSASSDVLVGLVSHLAGDCGTGENAAPFLTTGEFVQWIEDQT